MSAPTAEPTESPTGIEVDRVVAWLRERCDWLTPPLTWHRLPGGHSNLTYRVVDAAGNRFVLRRPPLGELLPSAHDMGREYRIIDALWPTPVPVPEPIAFCDDQSVTGANFYAMREVTGRSLYTITDVEALVPEENRYALGISFIDVLAALHKLDPEEVGLGRLGRPDAYVARQLKRWYESAKTATALQDPRIDSLHDFLVSRVPEQGPGRVVHGDYGLHNTISQKEGRIGAVVDWEISTLGDPLADLAYALNTWEEPGDASLRPDGPTLAPGFPKRSELLARYWEQSAREPCDLAFYQAFNHWKTVCILNGVLWRYHGGQKSTEGIDLEGLNSRRLAALGKAVDAAAPIGFRG